MQQAEPVAPHLIGNCAIPRGEQTLSKVDSGASFKSARDMAGASGERIAIGERTPRRRLRERGLLVSTVRN